MLFDEFQYLLGDGRVGTDLATIHLPVAQLFHPCILGRNDANCDLNAYYGIAGNFRAVQRFAWLIFGP
jgi:hypothetical protein